MRISHSERHFTPVNPNLGQRGSSEEAGSNRYESANAYNRNRS